MSDGDAVGWEDPSGEEPFCLMGIVNVTPDSFSDGGLYLDPSAAVAHGLELEAEGARILDIGGESTRPGAQPVDERTELARVLPVIGGLVAAGARAMISIDTSKAAVAERALAAGATIVNDISALRGDPRMAAVIADAGAACCLMHMQGEPRTMQRDPHYDDVVAEVRTFLAQRLEFALAAGVSAERILLDPGIGFGKLPEHNLELLARLEELTTIGPPILIGTSRKSFLGAVTGRHVDRRGAGTIATNVLAFERGARVFRVHEVAPVRDALTVAAATVRSGWPRTSPTSSTTTRT